MKSSISANHAKAFLASMSLTCVNLFTYLSGSLKRKRKQGREEKKKRKQDGPV